MGQYRIKEYLIRGYAINPRIEQLERRVTKAEEKIDFFIKSSLPPVQGIFFDGQVYDAYEFICGLIKSAKTRIVLIDKHNAQYPEIEVKEFKKSHDRFLILDNQVYLIGASLKDLGKKWFAVSLMSETDPDILLSRL